jgi:hypothetical protein
LQDIERPEKVLYTNEFRDVVASDTGFFNIDQFLHINNFQEAVWVLRN